MTEHLEGRLLAGADDLDAAIAAHQSGHTTKVMARPRAATMSRRRLLTAAAAATVAVAGGAAAVPLLRNRDRGSAATDTTSAPTTTTTAPSTTAAQTTTVAAAPAIAESARTTLDQPLGQGSAGEVVQRAEERLAELKFDPGPIDANFGGYTTQAIWAFQALVMAIPSTDLGKALTNEMWQVIQQPIDIQPRRWASKGEATTNHTEVYLPQQVVVFFQADEPALVAHISSGDGNEWREVVTIDPGELGNESGTAPLRQGRIGRSTSPGGVYTYTHFHQGRRQSALGGMYDPAYFNYGIAIHGAQNVPDYPDSHGCIRINKYLGERFQQLVAVDDQVFVWDGQVEPENCTTPYPWDRIDPDWVDTATTVPPGPPTTTTTPPAPAG